MELTGNLFNSMEPMLSPAFFDRIGKVLGMPAEKAKAAITTAIPAVFAAVQSRTATAEGARGIVSALKEGEFDRPVDAAAIDPSAINSQAEKGQNFISRIMGGNISGLTGTVAAQSGVSTSMAGKVVGLASTAVLSLLGSKLRGSNWSPMALSNAVSQVSPSVISGAGADSSAAVGAAIRFIPWLAVGLVAIALFWVFARRPAVVAPVHVPEVPIATMSGTSVVSAISAFLANPGAGAVPRAFSFSDLNFPVGSAALSAEAQGTVSKLAGVLATYPTAKIRIEGHTDSTGAVATNKQLSQTRADSLRDSLIAQGVAASRIEAVGFGSSQPVADNSTAQGRQQNRRTDVRVVSR